MERGADLHIAQLMPLPLTVSCFSKIQTGLPFLVLAHLSSPGKRAVKCVFLCVQGLPEWASTRRNIHPLTPILIIGHPLSTFSIYYDPKHPPCSVYVPDSPFPQPLSRSSLVYLLVWNPLLHTPYISSCNHYLPFAKKYPMPISLQSALI